MCSRVLKFQMLVVWLFAAASVCACGEDTHDNVLECRLAESRYNTQGRACVGDVWREVDWLCEQYEDQRCDLSIYWNCSEVTCDGENTSTKVCDLGRCDK